MATGGMNRRKSASECATLPTMTRAPKKTCACDLTDLRKYCVHVPRYDMIEVACWRFNCEAAEDHVAALAAELVKMYVLTYINCHEYSLMKKIRDMIGTFPAPYQIFRIRGDSKGLITSLYESYYAHVDGTSVYLQCDIYSYTRIVDAGMHVNFAFWGPPDVYITYEIREDVQTFPAEFKEKIKALSALTALKDTTENA